MKKYFILMFLLIFVCCFIGCEFGSDNNTDNVDEKCKITFFQDGQKTIVCKVNKGESLTDIPSVVDITGYTITWDRTDFSNITTDIIVKAIIIANNYTVYYDANGGVVDTLTESFSFDSEYNLKIPTKEGYSFIGWKYGNESVALSGTWKFTDNLTLIASYEKKDDGSNGDFTGADPYDIIEGEEWTNSF